MESILIPRKMISRFHGPDQKLRRFAGYPLSKPVVQTTVQFLAQRGRGLEPPVLRAPPARAVVLGSIV